MAHAPLAEPNRIRSHLKDGFIYPKVATTTCVSIIDGEMRFPSGLTRLNLRQRLSEWQWLLSQTSPLKPDPIVSVSGLCLKTEYKRSLCSILKLICHQPNSNPSPLQREIASRPMKTDWWRKTLWRRWMNGLLRNNSINSKRQEFSSLLSRRLVYNASCFEKRECKEAYTDSSQEINGLLE